MRLDAPICPFLTRVQPKVVSPVQWEATVAALLSRGWDRGLELGPGKTLSGIIKRADKTAAMRSVEL